MQYTSGDTVILAIGGIQLIPCISVSCLVISMILRLFVYDSQKIRFNSMNHMGHVLNKYFNQTNPQWRRRCKIIIT